MQVRTRAQPTILALTAAAGLLLVACGSSGRSGATSSATSATAAPTASTAAPTASTAAPTGGTATPASGTAADKVVFAISGSASGGVESHGDTALGADAVKAWHSYSLPLRASMPYQAPPAGPTVYSLFATFDSAGTATCTVTFDGHTYTGQAGAGSNVADPKTQQVCEVIVGWTGGLGWSQ